INLFWCETLYLPRPGLPSRADTIPDLVECDLETPSAMPHTMYISLNSVERPVDKWGALLAIKQEEMMHAIMVAIARDIEAGSPVEVLEQWRTQVQSCTGTFVVRTNAAARVHAALREYG
ncbi:MAG: hypothetical protein ACKPKO_38435, partial [Candidatus Fonsibacter sp.]